MTLGEIIDTLKQFDQTMDVRYDFSYSGPDFIRSYRGFYDELALTGLRYRVTVAEVLKMCEDAVGETFEGYKGGSYTMTRRTPVWFANASNECHDTAIKDITDEGYIIVIHTEYRA